MRKLLTRLGLFAGAAGAGIALSRALGSTDADAPAANPLPPCPDDPTCYRATRAYGAPTSDVVEAVHRAVRGYRDLVDGRAISVRRDGLSLEAVFAVGPFGEFLKDDLRLVIEGDSLGSVVHIRSASRVGRSDLGINRRRTERLLEAIAEELN